MRSVQPAGDSVAQLANLAALKGTRAARDRLRRVGTQARRAGRVGREALRLAVHVLLVLAIGFALGLSALDHHAAERDPRHTHLAAGPDGWRHSEDHAPHLHRFATPHDHPAPRETSSVALLAELAGATIAVPRIVDAASWPGLTSHGQLLLALFVMATFHLVLTGPWRRRNVSLPSSVAAMVPAPPPRPFSSASSCAR